LSDKTPLYQAHINAGGKIVDFSGWALPIHYGSQVDEHHQVRQDAGVFDVSHMTILDIDGSQSKSFLQHLLANDVDKLVPYQALYSAMCNDHGGVIDDLIAYWLDGDRYRLVVNAATRDKDIAWIDAKASAFDVEVEERSDLAMLAIQGPHALEKLANISQEIKGALVDLKAFFAVELGHWMIARTGYTGEDGVEVMLPAKEVVAFFEKVLAQGIKPCGLGARDTLRLEAGMNLYGTDMDEDVSPLAANMAWTIAWTPEDRIFIGREALEVQRGCTKEKLVGLVLQGKGVLRHGQRVITPEGDGIITSGTFSPTLKVGVGLARVPKNTGQTCEVDIRGKLLPAKVVKPCFVRHGKRVVE
tara:strand:+ start:2288 stop:3364 length:1077 start_codon:yes stop_codon:yes gene_type:complete